MNFSQIWIAVSIVVLAIVALLVLFVSKNRKEKRLTPFAGLAFGFVLAGMFFGENRLIGLSLMGVGVLFAVVDIVRNQNKAI